MDIPPFLHKPIDSWINQYIADIAYTRIILFQYVPIVLQNSKSTRFKAAGAGLAISCPRQGLRRKSPGSNGWLVFLWGFSCNKLTFRQKMLPVDSVDRPHFGFFTIRKRVKELQKMAFCHQKPIKRCFIHTTCVSIPTQVWVLPSKCVDIFFLQGYGVYMI